MTEESKRKANEIVDGNLNEMCKDNIRLYWKYRNKEEQDDSVEEMKWAMIKEESRERKRCHMKIT